MSGFVVATFVTSPGGWPLGIVVALGVAVLAGLLTGIGVGLFRVHPLIMTLGMSFVVLGLANVWQVLLLLYVISAVLAAVAGFLYTGLTNVASVSLVESAVLPSVAAAVIGGA